MKRFLFLVQAVLMTAMASASLPVAGCPRLLAFGSSDSCEWCRLLERRVFASDAWRVWASGHVEFVRVDLPRGDGVLAPDERVRNNALADRLGVKGIPTFVVLAPDGETELGRVKVPDSARGLGRDMTPEAFIGAVEEVLAATHGGCGKSESPGGGGERDGVSPWRVYRFIPVVALLCVAVFLLADKSKLPLALRGLKKVLGSVVPSQEGTARSIPAWKRLLAFMLILIAFLLAVL